MCANPSRIALKSVREQRGLNIADVSSSTGIALERLKDFEDGERNPSRRQVELLANAYGIESYSLFSDAIPNLPDFPRDFRKTDPSPSALSPKGMRTLWSSEQISHFTRQLAIELHYEPSDFTKNARSASSPRAKAKELRNSFETWLLPRLKRLEFTGSPEQRVMSALRLFFEVQGGVLNVNDAPASDYMGFFVKPDGGVPTIFVNRSISSRKAQLFTLAHEYAHALSGASGISNPFQIKNEVERSCNIFAAEFLEPMDQFKRIVEGISPSQRAETGNFVDQASAHSLLSKHATALRLIEGGYLSRAQYVAWRRLFRRNPKAEKEEEKESEDAGPMGAPHAKRIGEIGYLPIVLSRRAIDQKLVDGYDVASGIGLSPTLQQRAFTLATRRFEVALP